MNGQRKISNRLCPNHKAGEKVVLERSIVVQMISMYHVRQSLQNYENSSNTGARLHLNHYHQIYIYMKNTYRISASIRSYYI